MVVYRTMKILFLFLAYVGCCQGNVDYSSYDYDYSEVEVLTNAPPYRPSSTIQSTNNQEDGFDGDIRDSDEKRPHDDQPLHSLPDGEPPYSISAMRDWISQHPGYPPLREEPDIGSRPATPSQPSPPSRPVKENSPLGQEEKEWSKPHQASQPQREGQRPDTGSRPASPTTHSRPSRPAQDHRPLGHQQNPGIQILGGFNIPTAVILGKPGIFHQLPRQEHPRQPLAPQPDEVGQENVEGQGVQENVEGQGVQRKSPRSLRL